MNREKLKYKDHQRTLRKAKKYEMLENHCMDKQDFKKPTEYEKYRLMMEDRKRNMREEQK